MICCRPCRACGGWITGWRRREGRWEPLGIEGAVHACPPKVRRNWWARQRRRKGTERYMCNGLIKEVKIAGIAEGGERYDHSS